MNVRFSHNFLKVLGGTGTAQILNLFSSCVVSWFFQPVVVGGASVVNAAITSLGCFASLRYNQAILLPRRNSEAGNLIRLSLWIGAVFSFLVLILGLLSYHLWAPSLKIPLHWTTLLLIPLGVFMVAWFNVMSSLSNRMNRFGVFSVSRIWLSVAKFILILLFGAFLWQGEKALVIANIAGLLAAIVFLWKRMARERMLCRGLDMNLKKYALLMKKNREFPLFSAPVVLLTDLEASAPLYLFAFYYNPELVGQFAFGYAILRVGTAFLADSFRRVFFVKLIQMKNNRIPCSSFVFRLMGISTLLLTLIYGTFYLCGEQIFLFFFRDKWAMAGSLTVLLSLLMAFYALAEGMQPVFVVLNRQHQLFHLKIIGTLITVVGLGLALRKEIAICDALVFFSILGCFSKSFIIFLVVWNVRIHDRLLSMNQGTKHEKTP